MYRCTTIKDWDMGKKKTGLRRVEVECGVEGGCVFTGAGAISLLWRRRRRAEIRGRACYEGRATWRQKEREGRAARTGTHTHTHPHPRISPQPVRRRISCSSKHAAASSWTHPASKGVDWSWCGVVHIGDATGAYSTIICPNIAHNHSITAHKTVDIEIHCFYWEQSRVRLSL